MCYTLDMDMTQQIGAGLECDVYNIGNGRCYKDYRKNPTTFTLDKLYAAACLAADAGLGPDVYGRDEHGYITEIVEVRTKDVEQCYISEEYGELKAQLQDLFHTTVFDLHNWNIGIKNNKLICIDFGIGISDG